MVVPRMGRYLPMESTIADFSIEHLWFAGARVACDMRPRRAELEKLWSGSMVQVTAVRIALA